MLLLFFIAERLHRKAGHAHARNSSGSVFVLQLPPSYEQVVQDKASAPQPPPRRTRTASSFTPTNAESNTSQQLICQQTSSCRVKTPKKPPRPSPPRKHLNRTGSVVSPDLCDPDPIARPIPHPRSKFKLSSNQDHVPPLISPELHLHSSDVNSKHLEELLNGQCGLIIPVSVQGGPAASSEEDHSENMTTYYGDRDIRSRIKAFESQSESEESSTSFPRLRKASTKPPVLAPKPSIAPRLPQKQPEDVFDSHLYEEVDIPPKPLPKPPLLKKPTLSVKDEISPQNPFRVALCPPSRPSLVKTMNVVSQDEEGAFTAPFAPLKPSTELLNTNNHNNSAALLSSVTSSSSTLLSECVDASNGPSSTPSSRFAGFTYTGSSSLGVSRRPTVIRVPSKTETSSEEEALNPLAFQKAVSGPPPPDKPTLRDSFNFSSDVSLPPRPSGGKVLPARPPPAKSPAPRNNGTQRWPDHQGQTVLSKPQQNHRDSRRGAALPPRPSPGHRLYNKYTLEIPHGVAQLDYNGTNSRELSFQRNEVLVLLEELDSRTYECQAGSAKGSVQKSHMKIITPLLAFHPDPWSSSSLSTGSLRVQAVYDFFPEGPGELALKTGDVVCDVEKLDDEWYKGTCRNNSGFFPINYVKILNTHSPAVSAPCGQKPKAIAETVRGPRCVARFDFEAEQGDELSFREGDVIRLKEYLGEEWAQGELKGHVGIFPLIYVETIEDLPSASAQQTAANRIQLPGMNSSSNTKKFTKPSQGESSRVEWAVALYDFTAETDEDLAFFQGDRILVTAHLDEDWWSGRINGREGVFPKAYVETLKGGR